MSTKAVHRVSTIASIFVLVAFLACAGFTALSVSQITAVVEENIVANKNGVPTSWSSLEPRDTTESTTSATINNGYIEYVTSIKNSDPAKATNVTHISSFIQDQKNVGFIPLEENALEYTYTPSEENTWTPLRISAPDSDESGFKLDTPLYLGRADTSADTIYFRYNISPSEEGTVSDKVAFVTEDSLGNTKLTVGSASLDYDKTAAYDLEGSSESTESESSSSEASSTEADSSYTKPLGAFSSASVPSGAIINSSTFGIINIPKDSFTSSIIIIASALAVFVVSFIVYIIIHAKAKAKIKAGNQNQ